MALTALDNVVLSMEIMDGLPDNANIEVQEANFVIGSRIVLKRLKCLMQLEKLPYNLEKNF